MSVTPRPTRLTPAEIAQGLHDGDARTRELAKWLDIEQRPLDEAELLSLILQTDHSARMRGLVAIGRLYCSARAPKFSDRLLGAIAAAVSDRRARIVRWAMVALSTFDQRARAFEDTIVRRTWELRHDPLTTSVGVRLLGSMRAKSKAAADLLHRFLSAATSERSRSQELESAAAWALLRLGLAAEAHPCSPTETLELYAECGSLASARALAQHRPERARRLHPSHHEGVRRLGLHGKRDRTGVLMAAEVFSARAAPPHSEQRARRGHALEAVVVRAHDVHKRRRQLEGLDLQTLRSAHEQGHISTHALRAAALVGHTGAKTLVETPSHPTTEAWYLAVEALGPTIAHAARAALGSILATIWYAHCSQDYGMVELFEAYDAWRLQPAAARLRALKACLGEPNQGCSLVPEAAGRGLMCLRDGASLTDDGSLEPPSEAASRVFFRHVCAALTGRDIDCEHVVHNAEDLGRQPINITNELIVCGLGEAAAWIRGSLYDELVPEILQPAMS